ncbi:MAG: NAD(P)H-hydrate dehydratase [Betaproteobacteria bacterium]
MHTIPVYQSKHVREIEAAALAKEPIPPLMERAGYAAAELIQRISPDGCKNILVLAGPGNNGGDAFVTAKHLAQSFHHVTLMLVEPNKKRSPDAQNAFDELSQLDIAITKELERDQEYDFIVDGIFGIGVSHALSDALIDVINQINILDKPVLALDIPTGLNADSGEILGACIRATYTLTFLGYKAGLFTRDGPDMSGEVFLDMLGQTSAPASQDFGHLIGLDIVKSSIPTRKLNSHKGQHGRLLVVGGAPGMTGAAVLAARAALFSGAGSVTIGFLEEVDRVDWSQPEIMVKPLRAALENEKFDCIVIGPGLGTSKSAEHVLRSVLKKDTPVVLDADALNIIGTAKVLKTMLSKREAPDVITPHPGEAATLLETTVPEVQHNRIHSALDLAEELNCDVVLKGVGSVCAFNSGDWFINTSGNPGLAAAGMGDVLAGLIAALICQGSSPHAALLSAVHIHGLAGDRLLERLGAPVGITASEVILATRSVINEIYASIER